MKTVRVVRLSVRPHSKPCVLSVLGMLQVMTVSINLLVHQNTAATTMLNTMRNTMLFLSYSRKLKNVVSG